MSYLSYRVCGHDTWLVSSIALQRYNDTEARDNGHPHPCFSLPICRLHLFQIESPMKQNLLNYPTFWSISEQNKTCTKSKANAFQVKYSQNRSSEHYNVCISIINFNIIKTAGDKNSDLISLKSTDSANFLLNAVFEQKAQLSQRDRAMHRFVSLNISLSHSSNTYAWVGRVWVPIRIPL